MKRKTTLTRFSRAEIKWRSVSWPLLTLLLIGTLTFALEIKPVRATGTIYIRADGSIDPPTAPIFTVDNVTYTFVDNMNDSIEVQRSNIIVDGNGYTVQGAGYAEGIFLGFINNITVKNTRFQNFTFGIRLYHSNNSMLIGNNAAYNNQGITVYRANNNKLIDNIASNNGYGISLEYSGNNTLIGNEAANNTCNFAVYIDDFSSAMNYVDITNLVDNKSIYYLIGETDAIIDPRTNAGTVYLVNCGNMTVVSLNLSNVRYGVYLWNTTTSWIENVAVSRSDHGIWLENSRNNMILGNNLSNIGCGISLYYSSDNTLISNCVSSSRTFGIHFEGSSDNTLYGNTISNSQWGTQLYQSRGNAIYHNNFVNNSRQAVSLEADHWINTWDNDYPSGGNYWNDYNGTDVFSGPYQNETNSDGVGDTPYILDGFIIEGYPQDRYPLMNPYRLNPHDIGINVSISKTIVGKGFGTAITAIVVNRGVIEETFNFTFQMNATIQKQELTLPSQNSRILTFALNTTTLSKGNYTIIIEASAVPGETETDNNVFHGWIVVSIPGDLNADNVVDIYDAILLAGCFSSVPGSHHWNPNTDINGDGVVDIFDAIILASHFDEKDV